MRMKQFDLFPFEYSLLYDDGTAIDLTTATSVKIYMTLDEATSPTVDGQTCAIVERTTGKVQYQWKSPETSVVGMYKIEFIIKFDGSTLTVPSNDVIWMFILPSLNQPVIP